MIKPAPRKVRSTFRGLDIQVLYLEGVLLDELAPRLYLVAHQAREPEVGGRRVLDVDADDHPLGRVHRRLPELGRVHLAEALEAGDLDPGLGERERRLTQALERDRVLRLLAEAHREWGQTADYLGQPRVRLPHV